MENMNLEKWLGSLDLTNVEKKVVKINTSRRLPAVILVDTSGSMSDYEELLQNSVEELYAAISRDRAACNATELAVVCFNSDITILEKLREIKQHEAQGRNLKFHCDGMTLTGLALKKTIEQLEGRKSVYMNSIPRIRNYAPIIFFISDGKPECYDEATQKLEDEAMQYCKEYIRKEVLENRLIVISVEVGDFCDHNLMRELTGLRDDKHVMKVDNATELANFFKITSSIIISSSKTGSHNLNEVDFSKSR